MEDVLRADVLPVFAFDAFGFKPGQDRGIFERNQGHSR
jgi:hypothetical protein